MKNKICVVTGANSGIGKAVTNALAEAGASIALICRNQEKGDRALQEIREGMTQTEVFQDLARLITPTVVKLIEEDEDERKKKKKPGKFGIPRKRKKK
jgi:NAD(P)-dependent dehydrogenase (short-subunit alcohol dehydrogenase family)